MLESFEQRDLSNSRGGDALILMVKSDLFDGYYVVGMLVPGLVDNSVGALSNFVDALIAFHFRGC